MLGSKAGCKFCNSKFFNTLYPQVRVSCLRAGHSRIAKEPSSVQVNQEWGSQKWGKVRGKTMIMQRGYKLHFRGLGRQLSTREMLPALWSRQITSRSKNIKGEILDLARGPKERWNTEKELLQDGAGRGIKILEREEADPSQKDKLLESRFSHSWVTWTLDCDWHLNWFLLFPYVIPKVGRHFKMAKHTCCAAVKGAGKDHLPGTLSVENFLFSHQSPTLWRTFLGQARQAGAFEKSPKENSTKKPFVWEPPRVPVSS